MTTEENPQDEPTTPVEQPSKPTSEASASHEMPPASFSMLIFSLTSQALATLGLAPGPDGKPMEPELPIAKHLIDTLSVLEEKTKGNLDAEEARLLGESLTQLRLAYVAAKKG
jgi:hypothetical protein